MRDAKDVARVRRLAAGGANASQISRATRIPRSTVRGWLGGRLPGRHRQQRIVYFPAALVHRENAAAYAYVLGLYLGDGHISVIGESSRMTLALDGLYPRIVENAVQAIRELLPGRRVHVYGDRRSRLVRVVSASPHWTVLLPQHGPGPKHSRKIELTHWQSDITSLHARELVRGLIHSDGSRYIARQVREGRMYAYPRYSFTNRSADILEIFRGHLRLLGIDATYSRQDNVQIARKDSVARLDRFVGSKGVDASVVVGTSHA